MVAYPLRKHTTKTFIVSILSTNQSHRLGWCAEPCPCAISKKDERNFAAPGTPKNCSRLRARTSCVQVPEAPQSHHTHTPRNVAILIARHIHVKPASCCVSAKLDQTGANGLACVDGNDEMTSVVRVCCEGASMAASWTER